MSYVTEKEFAEAVEGLTWNILNLQARADAAETLLRVLAVKAGADAKKVEATLETIRETLLHKRLERIEDQSPLWAAKVDRRIDVSAVDEAMLKLFRWSP